MQGHEGFRPVVVHVIYRLAVGGMENGLVNLINRMASHRYRHVIVCMDDFTDFRERLQRDDVEVYALHKKPGVDLSAFFRFWRLLRQLRPAIVHTRNLGALEYQIPAFLAGVPYRVQGEHGRDTSDLDGTNRKYLLFRQLLNPLVSQYIALSQNLALWLENQAKVSPQRIRQIYNGVDAKTFFPLDVALDVGESSDDSTCDVTHGSIYGSTYRSIRAKRLPQGFVPENAIIIGTVGRLQVEKDQLTLVRAFIMLLDKVERGRERLRLVLVGEGPLREPIQQLLQEADAESLVWMPGSRNDAPALLQCLDIFVLPSLIEGVSNTILEAMATGLPVVATAVGGNPELVEDHKTGRLVPSQQPALMADALREYCQTAQQRQQHGQAGRQRVEQMFSMESMVDGYLAVYDALLGNAAIAADDVNGK
ncbi:MAG: glycosyltransferase [Ectothiorhodospiraceae bacterium]|nr:glycosyltransferase [Ectothiorhodospiraceae bacterium]